MRARVVSPEMASLAVWLCIAAVLALPSSCSAQQVVNVAWSWPLAEEELTAYIGDTLNFTTPKFSLFDMLTYRQFNNCKFYYPPAKRLGDIGIGKPGSVQVPLPRIGLRWFSTSNANGQWCKSGFKLQVIVKSRGSLGSKPPPPPATGGSPPPPTEESPPIINNFPPNADVFPDEPFRPLSPPPKGASPLHRVSMAMVTTAALCVLPLL